MDKDVCSVWMENTGMQPAGSANALQGLNGMGKCALSLKAALVECNGIKIPDPANALAQQFGMETIV